MMISALEGLRKPDPPFMHQRLCERLQLPPQACVLIEGSLRNTSAAIAQNMRAIEHNNSIQTKQVLEQLGMRIG